MAPNVATGIPCHSTRIEMTEFNTSLHHSSLSQDNLQSPRGPRAMGTANVFETKYLRVNEDDLAKELELPRKVSSI